VNTYTGGAVNILELIQNSGSPRPVSGLQINLIPDGARWSPTGFNVQPFEFIIKDNIDAITGIKDSLDLKIEILLAVNENHRRKDPDPGPCEIHARGAVFQNIRLFCRELNIQLREILFSRTSKTNLKKFSGKKFN
jgi:nitroreductase